MNLKNLVRSNDENNHEIMITTIAVWSHASFFSWKFFNLKISQMQPN